MATVVTKTIKPAGGGDYTTLAAWATARAGSKANSIEEAVCSSGSVGTCAFSASWILDATSSILIRNEVGENPEIQTTGAAAGIDIRNITAQGLTPITIDGIHFTAYYDGANYFYRSWSTFARGVIKNCIFHGNSKNVNAVYYPYTVENCIFYNASTGYGTAVFGLSSCKTINCTVFSFGSIGVSAGEAINCIVNGCPDGFGPSVTGDYNCSDIAGDAPGANSVTGTVEFVDATNHDYHLAATDTVARGAGVNLTSSGITTDIDGETRPATGAWDIGADYVPEPTAITIDVNPAGGGDYTSLQSAYDAEKHDLVAAGNVLILSCAAGNVGKLATDGACVTGPSNKLIISAATPHVGYVDGDCSYADNAGSTAPVLNLAYTQYVLVSRMLIGAAPSSVGIQCATDGLGTVIEGCIIKFGTGLWSGGNSGYIGVTGIFEIRGSYVDGFFSYGLRCDGACIIRSVTVRYCRNSVRGNIGNTLVQNVLVQGAGTCFSGTFDAASDYNMSNDASAPGAHSLTVQSATFADERALDSRLLDSSAGVYAGAEALAADRDILGTYLTALADAPCIGCAFVPYAPDPGEVVWWGGGFGVPKFGNNKYKHDYPAYGSGVQV